GFAHRLEGPLDLRFDNCSDSETAAELIRESSSEALKSILRNYGEIPAAGRIASALKAGQPETTAELVKLVESCLPYDKREKRLSQIFQALRITVNSELSSLQKFLDSVPDRLKSGGRLVIVSYHSLEDRMVKEFLVRESQSCICPPEFPVCVCDHKARFKVITKRVVKPDQQEIEANPRSRSARLRCGERIDG
nr:16S rRNA (cytosine(1402)-N(4))-methyltransferase RsmH [FCB group bacterium]